MPQPPGRFAYLLPAPGIPVQGPSGASSHVRGICRALDRRGDLRVYAAKKVDRRGSFGDALPAEVVGVGGWPSWLEKYRDLVEVRAARKIARRVISTSRKGWHPDVVIERHSLFSDAGWRIHDALQTPWILEVNAPLWQERGRFEGLRRPAWAKDWERRVLQSAPIIVTVSSWLVTWLREDLGCKNVHLIPNGVDDIKGDRDRGRAALGLSPSEKAIGFVGSMKPWHGIESLAGVATAVGARLVLLGRCTSPPPGAISPGHLPPAQLADAVAALDVGLVPYPADAPPWFCPLKILTYRAQGVPVVATDIADCRKLIGDAGTVVPPNCNDDFVSAVQTWLTRRTTPWVRSWDMVAAEVLNTASLQGSG